jgi:hypothetical protein
MPKKPLHTTTLEEVVVMTERVDRETIKREVIEKLTVVSEPEEPITEETKLFDDLGMGAVSRRAMALPYSKISLRHGGKPVTMAKAEALETVEESIDLVHERANA